MPIYEYECARCGCFEHSQSIHDRPLTRCPSCRRKVQRLISATSFQLRGGGWYADGYHNGKKVADGGSPDKAGAAVSADKPESSGATASKAKSSKKPSEGHTSAPVSSAASSS